jgi:TonB family protein
VTEQSQYTMITNTTRGTLLNIPLTDEKYGRSFLVSLALHGIVLALAIFGGYLLPSAAVQITGSGPGGGTGGEAYTVGVIEELSGGIGMFKPALTPKPPALLDETPAKNESKAIPLPGTVEPKKKKYTEKEIKKSKLSPSSNVVPTTPEPGAGGTGGASGGSGGGSGGGIGVSIGSGSGGIGDSWYVRTVEARISSNWIRPPEGVRLEIVYTFYIRSDGTIDGVRQEKSSGNAELDLTAERAIRASNPLAPPPPEFRGRPLQFIAQFVYPPNQ